MSFSDWIISRSVDKPRYNYFIPSSSVKTFLNMKYFLLKFTISDKGGIFQIILTVLDQ